MNYANLNISSSNHTFKYIVEYYDDPGQSADEIKYYYDNGHIVFYNEKYENIKIKKNYFSDVDTELYDAYLPSVYNISSFNIYFPRFSVDTYEKNIKYALTINTWVNGKYVYLCSYLLDRNDALACQSGPRKFLNTDYYDYIHIQTIDPSKLVYDDEWLDFRHEVCGEQVFDGDYQLNNTGSNINITLTPVRNVNGNWIKLDDYNSSQSAILLTTDKTKQYNLCAKTKMIFDDGTPYFNCDILYNDIYDSLSEYIKETYLYDTSTLTSSYYLFIKDKTDAYRYVEHNFNDIEEHDNFGLQEFGFNSWDEYIDGMSVNILFVIKQNGEDVIAVNSNSIFITKEIFKYLILSSEIRYINFNSLDMNVYNLNVVNRIENNIVSLERPDDYKNNLIRPIFIKTQESSAIKLHNSVNENIVINLDAYKSKVDIFTLKIGDTVFNEIGRINAGVVFKIIGTMLPEENIGTYYILDTNNEMVTSGNYELV